MPPPPTPALIAASPLLIPAARSPAVDPIALMAAPPPTVAADAPATDADAPVSSRGPLGIGQAISNTVQEAPAG